MSQFLIRIYPGNDKYRMSLVNQPFNQGILRLKIKHVVFIDPGRNDQEGLTKSLLGRPIVLKQLEQVVLKNHFAGSKRNIPAQFKCLIVRHFNP